MKDRTLWTSKTSKWKPRNLQAARITFPAKGINAAPPEPVLNVLEQRRQEALERKKKAEIAAKELEEHYARHKQIQQAQKAESRANKFKRPTRAKDIWIAHHLKAQAKSRKQKPPTTEEIQEVIKAYHQGKISFT